MNTSGGLSDGRLFRFDWVTRWLLAAVLGLILSPRVQAIDTTQCGFLYCESWIGHNAASYLPYYTLKCEFTGGNPSANSVSAYEICQVVNSSVGCPSVGYQRPTPQTSVPLCNCSSQPVIPEGGAIASTHDGLSCLRGCTYAASGPSVNVCSIGNPNSCQAGAAFTPNGNNCDPLDPTQPQQPPPAAVCDNSYGATDCIQPVTPPPPALPEICGTHGGLSVGCISPDSPCSSGPGGYLCGGNPPPSPPDPPPTTPPTVPPMTNPPPDYSNSNSSWGNPPVPITINMGGPPSNSAPCPAGMHGTPPACAADSGPCPDGTQPVNGTCAAPAQNCPDGTRPVAGQCGASRSGGNGALACADGSTPNASGVCRNGSHATCPSGHPSQNGVCYDDCPGGGQPVNGQCVNLPSNLPCPDGSMPVNGRCQSGGASQCNPATDPNHCNGTPQGNAGGGDTCGAPPFCSGNLIQCAELQQTWDTRCAISGTGTAPSDGSLNHLPGEVQQTVAFDAGLLDGSGWVGGGACPDFGTVSVMDQTWVLGGNSMCDFYLGLGALFQLLCAFKAVSIAVRG